MSNVVRSLPALVACAMIWGASSVCAQPLPGQAPAHPRLLFRASDIPNINARINGGGVPAWAWAQVSGAASWQGGSGASWQVYLSLRSMVEAAARWKITGSTVARDSALAVLIRSYPNAVSSITPTGTQAPYVQSTYPGAIAMAFDMLYDELTPSERQTIVARLEQWIAALYAGASPVAPYYAYGGATDNYSFAWNSGIALALLAIWGEPSTNRPNIPQEVDTVMERLRDGWKDAFSPDGSVDGNSGYALYGGLYAIRAAIAASNCGFPDYLAGTNVPGTPLWYGRQLMGDTFFWTGDSDVSHRGVQFDPVLYHVVSAQQDSEGLWCLDRLRMVNEVGVGTTTFAHSAFLSMVLRYPTNLAPTAPRVMSRLFRDNQNIVPPGQVPNWNKTHNNAALGEGGAAYLHNGTAVGAALMGVHYIVRDEWMNHSHEDDGHVDLMVGGVPVFFDRGYAQSGSFADAQSTDHNIVTVGGQGYLGHATNYYACPAPQGSYQGRLGAKLLTPEFDYVRGEHSHMWMMEEAERSVVMCKDPTNPFVVVLDHVRKGAASSNYTYEQRWNAASTFSGTGTASNPFVMNAAGQIVRATYLSPSTVSYSPGAYATTGAGSFFKSRFLATGTGRVTIMGVYHAAPTQGSTPLSGAGPGVKGATLHWGTRDDKLMVAGAGVALTDAATSSDGRFAWMRSAPSGTLQAYALAEGTLLVHGGQQLVASSEPVTVVVKGGDVSISRAIGSTGTTPSITLTVPGTINLVYLDGALTTFNQTGNVLTVGGQPPIPTGPTGDRFYTFTDGYLGDAVPSGVVVQAGAVISGGGNARLDVSGGNAYPHQPLSAAVDVLLQGASSTGDVGGLQFSSAVGAGGDVVEVTFYESSGWLFMFEGNTILATIPPSPGAKRISVQFEPAQGSLTLWDRHGVAVGSGGVFPFGGPLVVSLRLAPGAVYDNLSVYDSAEDGVTPQGLAVWLTPSGKAGVAAQHGTVLLPAHQSVSVASMPVPTGLLVPWMGETQFCERLVVPFCPSPSLSTREVCLENGIPGIYPTPGLTYGVTWVTGTGMTFQASATF